jgi:thymidylate synthase ThyX
MQTKRRIYLLDPQQLPPETIAVAFAKTSRSPQSFDAIASELSDEKSAQFHEKWVVGYGHASVAEHAVLHIAVENVSRLAVECLESNRLASYTEKSTRYQQWDNNSFHTPHELNNHPLLESYQQIINTLFSAYADFLPKLEYLAKEKFPQNAGESDNAWKQRIRTHYIDVARFLLPAASLANVGITINARALEHALQKMFAHSLHEVRQIGAEIREIAQAEVPTLVKYITPGDHLQHANAVFQNIQINPNSHSTQSSDCELVAWDENGEERVLAAALYRYQHISYTQALSTIQAMQSQEKARLIKTILDLPEKFDIPIRELEHTNVTFDVLLDQGAYFELKRHRLMTQSPQDLSTRWSYATPLWINQAGLADSYHELMHQVMQVYPHLENELPGIGSYIIPNAFNRRVLLTLNMRSMFHLVKLRCAENAHFSIRRATGKMLEQLIQVYPGFGQYFQSYACQSWQQLQSEFFQSTQCY